MPSALPILGQPSEPAPDPAKIRIGVSACLLGGEVRYDGGHKRNAFVTGTLGRLAELVPVCPEVEMGMGTPRPPIRLERTAGGEIRLLRPSTGEDFTEGMRAYAARRVGELAELGLDGYVLKKDSPSCGMAGVKVYGSSPAPNGRGLFAEELSRRLPDLPVVEEDQLDDPLLRDDFMARVLRHHRRRTGLPALEGCEIIDGKEVLPR